MPIFFNELKIGLSETSKYLLSHHLPNDYDKCISIYVGGKIIHLCSRCSGVYIGISTGFLANLFHIFEPNMLIILIFPMFALIDWFVTAFNMHKSNNTIRIASGFFLGLAYIFAALLAIREFPNFLVITTGALYALLAVLLLALRGGYKKLYNGLRI